MTCFLWTTVSNRPTVTFYWPCEHSLQVVLLVTCFLWATDQLYHFTDLVSVSCRKCLLVTCFLWTTVSNRQAVTLNWPCEHSVQEVFAGDLFSVSCCEWQTNCKHFADLVSFPCRRCLLVTCFLSAAESVWETVTPCWQSQCCEQQPQSVFCQLLWATGRL